MELDLSWCAVCGARIPQLPFSSSISSPDSLYCSQSCLQKDSNAPLDKIIDVAHSVAFQRSSSVSTLASSMSSYSSLDLSLLPSQNSPDFPFLSPTLRRNDLQIISAPPYSPIFALSNSQHLSTSKITSQPITTLSNSTNSHHKSSFRSSLLMPSKATTTTTVYNAYKSL